MAKWYEILQKELGRTGINVNAIAPGYINTPMTDKLFTEFL
jgi:NAD(P)-dependent dehydrogenase (short-subunit alcohol dehydrogenase family)